MEEGGEERGNETVSQVARDPKCVVPIRLPRGRGHPRLDLGDNRTLGVAAECARESGGGHSRSRRRWWRCSSRCMYRRRNGAEGTICRRRSHRSAATRRGGGEGNTLVRRSTRVGFPARSGRGDGAIGHAGRRIDVYSSFDGELDSGAHQELEEVVTAGRQGEEGSAGRQRREICQGGQRLRVTLGDGKEPGRRGAASAPNGRRERALADVAGTKGTWHSLFGVHLAWALRGRNLEWEGTGHHYRLRPRSRSHKTASKCNRPIFSTSHQLYQRPPAQSVRV